MKAKQKQDGRAKTDSLSYFWNVLKCGPHGNQFEEKPYI